MKWKAEIAVLLKESVLDPQGDVVRQSLQQMGYQQVSGVRVGKFMEVELEAPDGEEATASVENMCRRLLANPVIEDFRFELQEVRPC